ncbi:sugar nucleotide-binding protein [Streptomyces sp. NBS 14/10]|uniref:SDR family oxidoreductase n=1 Tax=Streptomyces sp. NBS 14/10 TaxID=1945643 RepID=UPI000B7D3BFF|nr:sugar nucleotide-binding protein [Streptomyces sp. NBS 14/10]KAK1184392.1 sugar nucleotide-binding protein [Streptomyces sp. NBS 14/10]
MTVLIVGSGFVGTAVARRLGSQGRSVVLASRTPPTTPVETYGARWTPLDATDPGACSVTVSRLAPSHVILVHGPSNVTWCEANPARAAVLHTAVAENIAMAATSSSLLLISTDNVFSGTTTINAETSPTCPANAYGRAKLDAERVLLARTPAAIVLRVSLVYGYESVTTGKWLNFFAACAHRLSRGAPVQAPSDQWTTPVHVDDVAAVVTALLTATTEIPSLLHLGGPDRISRAQWAGTIAESLQVPRSLVTAVPKASGRYAARPENTCLTSHFLSALPAVQDVAVRGVVEAAHALAPAFLQ